MIRGLSTLDNLRLGPGPIDQEMLAGRRLHELPAWRWAALSTFAAGTAAIPNGLDYGPGGKCVLCASCDAHYCTLDANGVCQRSCPVPIG